MTALSVSDNQIDKMILYCLAGLNSIEISMKMKLPHEAVKATLEFIFTNYGDYVDSMAKEFYSRLSK